MSDDFEPSELEALRKVARERIAYDTLTNKVKQNWIWAVGAGVLTIWALWDNVHSLLTGVK